MVEYDKHDIQRQCVAVVAVLDAADISFASFIPYLNRTPSQHIAISEEQARKLLPVAQAKGFELIAGKLQARIDHCVQQGDFSLSQKRAKAQKE
jgi:hypothetical protein